MTSYLTVLINFVILQHSKLHFLFLVLDFLRCCVILLLSFLTTTSKSKNQMKCGLLLDVVITQSATVLQLFTSKNKTLLVGWNTFFVLDLGFNIINGITWFDLESDG